MRGQVLQVDAAAGGGIILGSDGNRYSFNRSDWKGPSTPAAGSEVDFISGDGVAQDIFPLPGASSSASAFSASTSIVAAPTRTQSEGSSVLLGVIGILCLVLGFVIPVLPTIAALILGLIGADSAKRHNNESGLILSRISWIGALILLIAGTLLIIGAMMFAWPLLDVIWQYMLHVAQEESTTAALLTL
jgi:hypothetical protein